jgi:hypothetical protein
MDMTLLLAPDMVGKDSCLIEGFAEANILNVKLSKPARLIRGGD